MVPLKQEMQRLSRTEEAVIDTLSDGVVGAGTEYAQTGQVTAEGLGNQYGIRCYRSCR